MRTLSLEHHYLLPIIKDLLALDDQARIAHIEKDHWIGYQRAQQALQKLSHLFTHPKRNRMPNLLIVSPTNNGKTMLIHKFFRDHFPERAKNLVSDDDLLLEAPVISMQMPANPDVKRFYLAMMNKLDTYNSLRHRTTLSSFEPDVYREMKKFNVRMLIIDEIHNVLAGTYRQQIEFLNVIRYIGNEVKIPIVCVGTKEAYLAIRSDPQLENRFEPFALPVWKAGNHFEALLASFVALLPLKNHSHLSQPEISEYILAKSEGIIGEIATFLKRAAILAINTGQECIDKALLEQVDYHSPSERRQMFERELV